MATRSTDRTGVLIARAWVEPDPIVGTRIRVTRTLDVNNRQELASTVVTAEEVCQLVRSWLEEFVFSTR